jgi:hypothetical protein
VEQAFQYLYEQPMSFPPPKELRELNNAEWMVLDQLLQNLLAEREYSQLQ